MRTLLVVDDHPLVGEMVRTILESRGYRVLVVRDGTAALAAVEHAHFDGTLIDVDLPGMTGIELVRALRQRSREARRPFAACLMTGSGGHALSEAAQDAGAMDVLLKPFSIPHLITLVERMCRETASSEAA